MKKLIIILLVLVSVVSAKANAAIKVVGISHNLQKVSANSKTNFNVRYITFTDNGYIYLLTIYDNGGTTLTLLGPMYIF